MPIKLTDVAKKAGVSPTTVSRVINNYGSLSQKTIDNVHAAMRELNYQPNSLARSLQGKNTQLVGLVFPTISHPFFGELVEKIETKFFERGYKSILCNSANNKEKERHYLRMLASNKVDGIIAGAHNLEDKEYEELKLPLVSFDQFLANNIPIVGGDNYQGGYIATQNLFESGGERIGIITGCNAINASKDERLKGYTDFINENNLTENIFYFDTFEHSIALKNNKIKRILMDKKVDSLFCTDDLTALLVINQCKELNITIPEDLRIIGYDGTRFIQNYYPQLSTIIQPIEELAELLVELLIQRITFPEKEFESSYRLPNRLSQGQTT